MKLGDKVTINKILPFDIAGRPKLIKNSNKGYHAQYNREVLGDSVIYKTHKIDIPERTGIIIGFRKKKLCRIYYNKPVSIRLPRVLEPENDRWRRAENRTDNPYKYDTVAIIALSNYRSVMVDVKDLIYNNIKII